MDCFVGKQQERQDKTRPTSKKEKIRSHISPSADTAIQMPSTSSLAQQCPAQQKRQVTPGT
jgi:hypothetical protein